ncbi:AarF/UbiB family protein [Clostridium sp. KNHs214]|uniref:protein kinase domain-containing protein n=1 Tax=Clostridium sp. KNHs214 TaxID=1540257 RepID=UPI000556BD56|nr:AarF/UbiB family protein [Clostridium sp. KNHs214]
MKKIIYYKNKTMKHIRAFIWLLLKYSKFKKILNEYGISRVKPYKFFIWHHGSHYFTAFTTEDNKKVFIKTGGKYNLIYREASVLKYIQKNKDKNSKWSIPNIVQCLEKGEFSFLAIEYIDGLNLSKLIEDNVLTPNNQIELLQQFNEICDFFFEHKLIHRDIRPDNIIINLTPTFLQVILIDFAFTVSDFKKEYNELQVVKESNLLYRLGAGLNPEPFVWDDAYSFCKVTEQVNNLQFDDTPELNLLKSKIGRLRYICEGCKKK